MSDIKKTVEPNLETHSEEATDVATASTKEERRGFLGKALGILSFGALAACEGGVFSGDVEIIYKDAPGGDDGTGDPGDPIVTAGGNPNSPCSDLGNNVLTNAIEAPANYVPAIKFYGTPTSCLLAFDFANLTQADTEIAQIIVLDENNKLLCLKAIGNADRSPNGNYRVISFENLNLRGTSKVMILPILKDGKRYKRLANVEFENTYKGLPVVNAANMQQADSWYTHQAIPNFKDTGGFPPAGYNIDENKNFFDGRRLYTMQAESSVLFANDLGGKGKNASAQVEVTDLAGNFIAMGGNFTDIIEHNMFVVYKLVNNRYYRTIIKMG